MNSCRVWNLCDIVVDTIDIVKCYKKAIKHDEASHCLHMRRIHNNATESDFEANIQQHHWEQFHWLSRKSVNERIITKQCTARLRRLLCHRFFLSLFIQRQRQTENPFSACSGIRSQYFDIFSSYCLNWGHWVWAVRPHRLNVAKHQMVVDLLRLFWYDTNGTMKRMVAWLRFRSLFSRLFSLSRFHFFRSIFPLAPSICTFDSFRFVCTR